MPGGLYRLDQDIVQVWERSHTTNILSLPRVGRPATCSVYSSVGCDVVTVLCSILAGFLAGCECMNVGRWVPVGDVGRQGDGMMWGWQPGSFDHQVCKCFML
jgi:hypothetical protein